MLSNENFSSRNRLSHSRFCQEKGAAASQTRCPDQPHSRATHGLVGPELQAAAPSRSKANREKIQKKEKENKQAKKNPSNNSNNNKAKQNFLTVKVPILVGDALLNPPASVSGPQNQVERLSESPKSEFNPKLRGHGAALVGTHRFPQPSLRPNAGKTATRSAAATSQRVVTFQASHQGYLGGGFCLFFVLRQQNLQQLVLP